MAKKSDNKKKAEDKRFLQAFSYCGDPKEAAKIVGIKMSQAYRALCDPDGLAYLEELCSADNDKFFKLDRAQRKALLTMAAVGGIIPRIVFDEDGPGDEILYDSISTQQRFRCLEMLGKMEGDFVEKKEILTKDEGTKIVVNTGVPRSPVDKQDEDDPLAL